MAEVAGIPSRINEILERYRNGEKEAAFFDLLEMPGDVLHELTRAFQTERFPEIRAFLVKVAWQRRQKSVLPFLGEALNDMQETVWQEALDGLVTFASPEALEILRQAHSRKFTSEAAAERFRLWLEEAIQQVQEVIRR
jgi:HEAT repeat protein